MVGSVVTKGEGSFEKTQVKGSLPTLNLGVVRGGSYQRGELGVGVHYFLPLGSQVSPPFFF